MHSHHHRSPYSFIKIINFKTGTLSITLNLVTISSVRINILLKTFVRLFSIQLKKLTSVSFSTDRCPMQIL